MEDGGVRASGKLNQANVVKICFIGGAAGTLCAVLVCAAALVLVLNHVPEHFNEIRPSPMTAGYISSKKVLSRGRNSVLPSASVSKHGTHGNSLSENIGSDHENRLRRYRRSKKAKPAIHVVPKAGSNPSVAPVSRDGTFCHWQTMTISNDGGIFHDPFHNVVVFKQPGAYYVYGQVYLRAKSRNTVSYCLFRGHKYRSAKWYFFDLSFHDLNGSLVCGIMQPHQDLAQAQFKVTNDKIVMALPRDALGHAYHTYGTTSVSGIFYFDEDDTLSIAIAGDTDESGNRKSLRIGIQHNFTYFGAFMVN